MKYSMFLLIFKCNSFRFSGVEVDIDFDTDASAAFDVGEFLEGEVAPLVFEACHIAEADVCAVPILDIPGEAAAGVEEFDAEELGYGFAFVCEVVRRHFHEAAGLLHEGQFLRAVGDAALLDMVLEVGVLWRCHLFVFLLKSYHKTKGRNAFALRPFGLSQIGVVSRR